MSAIDKILEDYALKLYKNHNNAKEKEQNGLVSLEDYREILRPVAELVEYHKDSSLEELRDMLYNDSKIFLDTYLAIYRKNMTPGAVISYGTLNYHETVALGSITDDSDILTTKDTYYDLASVTKLFTSISIQILSRKGLIDLNKPVTYYLPEFLNLGNITIFQLLTFNAPVKTDGRVDKAKDKDEAEKILKTISFNKNDNSNRPYTDMGAMVLKYVVEKVIGKSFYEFVNENILIPSNMTSTKVNFSKSELSNIAPTGGNGFYYKDGNYRINNVNLGECYDEKARIMGQKEGILSGHAGLFSTANDMTNLAICLLNEQILTDDELVHMADNYTGNMAKGIQYLGKLCYSKNPVQVDSEIYHPLSGRSFASAGWTGTQLTIDPDNKIFYSLLSNRSNNRMTFIDDSKKGLVGETIWNKKILALPNGKEMVDASRFAWDRDEALVYPAIDLSIKYAFLEEIYNIKEQDPVYKIRRIEK